MRGAAVILLSLLAASMATTPTPLPTLKAYEYLQGEWDVTRSSFSFSGSQDEGVAGKYIFAKQNGTNTLSGRYYENNTGEITNELSLAIEFADPTVNVATFKTGDADSDDLRELFSFDFKPLPTGVHLSFGDWHGAKSGSHYQFLVAGDTFTITVLPAKDSDSLVVYSARRVVAAQDRSFFQQWGPMIMIAGVFFMNQFLQRRMAPRGRRGGAGGGQQAAATGASAGAVAAPSEGSSPSAGAKKSQ